MNHTYQITFHYGIGNKDKKTAIFKADDVASAKSLVRAQYRPKGPENLFIDNVKVLFGYKK